MKVVLESRHQRNHMGGQVEQEETTNLERGRLGRGQSPHVDSAVQEDNVGQLVAKHVESAGWESGTILEPSGQDHCTGPDRTRWHARKLRIAGGRDAMGHIMSPKTMATTLTNHPQHTLQIYVSLCAQLSQSDIFHQSRTLWGKTSSYLPPYGYCGCGTQSGS